MIRTTRLLQYALGLLSRSLRGIYRVLAVVLSPMGRMHPRLRRFGINIREAFKELLRPPGIPVESWYGAEGEGDLRIEGGGDQGREGDDDQGIPYQSEAEADVPVQLRAPLPDWLITEWRAINEIEPLLFPERWLVDNVPLYMVPKSRIGAHYLELCGRFGADISHVFLVPWLKRGGADLVALNYIRALVSEKLTQGVTVIGTLDADSPWAQRLPTGVRFIEYGKLYAHLEAEDREKLLARVLLQMAPAVIHNINSELGYSLFVKYGRALSSISSLYVCSFCEDVSEEGRPVGYPFTYLPHCFDHLKAVMSDNQSQLDKLCRLYAFDPEKLVVHYQPMSLDERHRHSKERIDKKSIDVLWAGRIDRQKRPDLVLKIARMSEHLPFTFHVYGSAVIDCDSYTHELSHRKNIRFYGAFDGLSSLPVDDYDVLLYTSQWDGLPNVLLEAIALGLPVVASRVGGVPELIRHRETGFLVEPFDNIEGYVDCLKEVSDNGAVLIGIKERAIELVRARHSWNRFIEGIKAVPGYLTDKTERVE